MFVKRFSGVEVSDSGLGSRNPKPLRSIRDFSQGAESVL